MNVLVDNEFIDMTLPIAIRDNLNPKFPLRTYQTQAFAKFIYYQSEYKKKINPTHLLFNMATGSGKTLVMAGLILYLYEMGYRNFLFFVNTTNIIDKTKDNFCNPFSSKYLFAPNITINNQRIPIRQVNNFADSNDNAINICFTTIHKLHLDLKNLSENSLSMADFADKKIVLLSDEAHHIQTQTLAQKELIEKPSWENTVENIFTQNDNNILLEFTATLDYTSNDIVKKYQDKVLHRYDLTHFREEGFSKDIKLMQSDLDENDRMLQAVIINQYRQDIADKYNIALKPVILFKAQHTIEESLNNQRKFEHLIENLHEGQILTLFDKSYLPILKQAKQFFMQNMTAGVLCKKIQQNFAKNKTINVNEINLDLKSVKKQEKQLAINQQNILNSLEENNNQIRVIFAVNKLNEGWDVLNLFDIVRLSESSSSAKGKTTNSEAQLIGRGARYYPFKTHIEQDKYTRKFDNDLNNELRILEELYYYSKSDSRYINELTAALVRNGLIDYYEEEYVLEIKAEFKETDLFQNGFVYLNERIKNTNEQIQSLADFGISKVNVHYNIATGISSEVSPLDNTIPAQLQGEYSLKCKTMRLSDFDLHIMQKALAKNPFFYFNNLVVYFPNVQSLKQFMTSPQYLAGLAINFYGLPADIENINNSHYLNGLHKLLKMLENEIKAKHYEYKGSKEFKPYPFKDKFVNKKLKIPFNDPRVRSRETDYYNNKKWYIFNAHYGTEAERKLVRLMEQEIDNMMPSCQEIYLVRNEQHVAIYNFDDGKGFMPDYILFIIQKNGSILTYQIFLEAKGSHLIEHDEWKSNLLCKIQNEHKDNILQFSKHRQYKIYGLPFYEENRENAFKIELDKFKTMLLKA